MKANNDMPDEVDFTGGSRGRFAGRLSRNMQVVVIEPDVARAFPSSDEVNQTLREVMQERSSDATDAGRKAS